MSAITEMRPSANEIDPLAPLPNRSNQIVRIQPQKGWASLDLGELWRYRELLYYFTWRDIKVRYKQTVLGASWAILQPLMTMIVFSLFFGQLARIGSDGVPYPIFSYAALVPWTFFATGLMQTSSSLVSNQNTLKKVYFPRLLLPVSSLIAVLVDFLLAFVVLILLMLLYGIAPTWNIVWLPALMLLAFVTALGVGLWLSALNVQYRDVRYVIPFLLQFWLFASPIVYPSSLIEDPAFRVLYGLNPMAGVIEGFRWALLGTDSAPGAIIIASAAAALLLLVSGVWYFRRAERRFADVI